MQDGELSARARARAHIRKVIGDLRYWGVDDDEIARAARRGGMIGLDDLLAKTISTVMTTREPSSVA